MKPTKLFVLVLLCFMGFLLTGCETTAPANSSSTNSTSSGTDSTTSNPTTTNNTVTTNPSVTGQQSGLDGENITTGAQGVSGVAQRVAQVAATFPSRYASSGSFQYAPGTENGNLGCANVVSAALKEAGVNVWSLGVTDCANQLAQQGWSKVQPPPYKDGDVVIWSPPPGGAHGHIGIVARNGNSQMAMNNSSSARHPVWSAIEHRAVAYVMRKA